MVYASRDLYKRPFWKNNQRFTFIADPGTQRWIIGTEKLEKFLRFADGKKSIIEIADSSGIQRSDIDFFYNSAIQEGILFQDKEHYENACLSIIQDTEVKALHLEITNQCNLRCKHCYLSSGKRLSNELSKSEIFDIIDTLPPGSGNKVCITGGEPFMHPDFFAILDYTTRIRGLEADIYTNGTLINEDVANRLADLYKNTLYGFNIQLSIEGPDAKTNDEVRGKGTFDQVLQALKNLERVGLESSVVLFACLTKNNINRFSDFVDMANELHVKGLKFSQWQKQGRSIDTSWESISPSLNDWIKCGYSLLNYQGNVSFILGNFYGDLKNNSGQGFSLDSQLFPKFFCHLKIVPRIDCQGNVWPCQLFVDNHSNIGNIRDNNLNSLFGSEKYKELFQKCKDRKNTIKECQDCEWLHFCGGGCPAFAYAEKETLQVKDYFCNARKYWFDQYIQKRISNFLIY